MEIQKANIFSQNFKKEGKLLLLRSFVINAFLALWDLELLKNVQGNVT